jgi:hypothetical protein
VEIIPSLSIYGAELKECKDCRVKYLIGQVNQDDYQESISSISKYLESKIRQKNSINLDAFLNLAKAFKVKSIYIKNPLYSVAINFFKSLQEATGLPNHTCEYIISLVLDVPHSDISLLNSFLSKNVNPKRNDNKQRNLSSRPL